MATAPSPNDLTRQQLDELDALLQRMLSVPLPAEPAPGAARGGEGSTALADPPLPPSWRADPPPAARPAPAAAAAPFVPAGTRDGGAAAPHLLLVEPPSAAPLKFELPLPPPAVLTQTPAPAPPKPVAKSAAPAPAPAAKAPPAPAAVPAPVAPPPLVKAPAPGGPVPGSAPQAPAGLAPPPAAPPVPFVVVPLLVVNALFDTACGLLGPVGRVLRSGFCKNVYGLVGLGLLAYTAAHVAQRREWVTLPVTLPWPR